MMTEKTCTECGRTLPISEFYEKGRGDGGIGSYFSRCKNCVCEYQKKSRKRLSRDKTEKRHRVRTQVKAYLHLSPDGIPKCAVCGFSGDPQFLQIDHIGDDGPEDLLPCGKKRTGIHLERAILKLTPEEARKKYQLLCSFHNWTKMYGIIGTQYAVVKTGRDR